MQVKHLQGIVGFLLARFSIAFGRASGLAFVRDLQLAAVLFFLVGEELFQVGFLGKPPLLPAEKHPIPREQSFGR